MKTIAILLAVITAGLIAIMPGFNSPAYLDDSVAMNQTREFEQEGKTIPQMLITKEPQGFFRPTKTLVFALISQGTKTEKDPLIQKRINIARTLGYLNHILAAVALFLLARSLSGNKNIAVLATAFWLFSPSVTGPSTWLSSQNIPLALGCMLIGLTLADKAYRTEEYRKPLTVLAMLFYATSLLAYDTAISFIPLLALIYLYRGLSPEVKNAEKSKIYKVTKKAGALIPAVIITALWLTLRKTTGAISHGAETNALFDPETKPIQVFFASAWFHWRLFLMWVWPFGTLELVGTYIPGKSTTTPHIIGAWVFLLTLIATGISCFWRGSKTNNNLVKFLGASILLALIATIPSGNYIPIYSGPFGDYYTAFPAAGWCMAKATIAILLFQNIKKNKSKTAGAILAVIVAHGILLAQYVPQRAKQFTIPGEIERLSVESRPYQYMQQNMLGVKVYARGERKAGLALIEEAIKTAPWLTRIQYAQVLEQEGRLEEAEKQYDIEIKTADEKTLTYAAHRKILFHETRGEYAEIKKLAEKILPDVQYEYHESLAAIAIKAAARSGDKETAQIWLSKARRFYPQSNLLTQVEEEEKLNPQKNQ